MIVVPIQLWSAITGAQTTLGTMVIDNVATRKGGSEADYRVRMYKKTAKQIVEQVHTEKPIREGQVIGHKRVKEPVQNLVAKALKEMGYG